MSWIKSEYSDLDKYDFYGDIYYYKKGTCMYHNQYGPAITWKDKSKFYFIYNKRHRLDGPAVIWPDGEEEYYIDDEKLSKEEFECHPERLKFLGKDYLICIT